MSAYVRYVPVILSGGGGGGNTLTVGLIDSQTPSTNGAVIAASVLYMQSASNTVPGLINTDAQTFAGAKTFSTSVIAPFFQDIAADPATGGVIRLATTGEIHIRNSTNTDDAAISVVNEPSLGADVFAFSKARSSFQANAAILLDYPLSAADNRGLMYAGTYLSGNSPLITPTIHGTPVSTSFLASGSNDRFTVQGINFSDSVVGPSMGLFKSRGTVTSPTIVNSGDILGTIGALGFDGTDFEFAAQILFSVNGTPGNNDMPGAILFQTTPDGGTTPSTVLTLDNTKKANFTGQVLVSVNGAASAAPFAVTGIPFSGGTSTTTKPLVKFGLGATDNNWSTNGTILGINPATSFTGNLIDAQINAVRKFSVDATGAITATSISNAAGVPVQGTNTNNSAAAGFVGEYITASGAATNLPTTTQWGDLTSISLTAGDWDVTGIIAFTRNTATILQFTEAGAGISTTTGNSTTGLTLGDTESFYKDATAGIDTLTQTVPAVRMSLSGTTVVYLKMEGAYSAGQPQAQGRISARRVR